MIGKIRHKKIQYLIISQICLFVLFPINLQANHPCDEAKKANLLAKSYIHTNLDSCQYFLTIALKTAQKNNCPEEIATAYHNKGTLAYLKANYQFAIEYYDKALKIRVDLNDKQGIAATQNNRALVFALQKKYIEAIDANLQALKLREEIKDSIGIAKSLNNIGMTYHQAKNINEAIPYYKKALDLKRILGDKQGIATSSNNLGQAYFDKIQVTKNYSDIPIAEAYFKEALKLNEELQNEMEISKIYSNLGNLYAFQKYWDKGIKFHEQSLAIQLKNKDIAGQSLTALNIGNLNLSALNYKEAKKYLDESLRLAYQIKNTDLVCDILKAKSLYFAHINNFDSAYYYRDLYTQYNDSLLNTMHSEKMAELASEYQLEKKERLILEKENLLNQQRISSKKFTIIILSSFAVLLVFTIVLLLKLISRKNYLNQSLELKSTELIKSKKSLTDSIEYAKSIQNALLPSFSSFLDKFEQSFILFKPKDIVSGDFIWYKECNNSIYLALVDCTGHGVPGAFISLIANDLLNQIILEKKKIMPAEILTELNKRINKTLKKKKNKGEFIDGMDIGLCKINQQDIDFAGARIPLIIASNGKLNKIKPDIYPIGELTAGFKVEYTNQQITIKKGDCIYLFSDGIYDQLNENNVPLKMGGLLDKLEEVSEIPIEKQKNALESFFNHWKGNQFQTDDVAILGLKF